MRYSRALSQRELAVQLGVGKSTIGRFEKGQLTGPLAMLQGMLDDLGFEISLVDRRGPADRARPDADPHPDAEAEAIVACWRRRVDDEEVRDAAGRRTPAHVHVFPIRVPHRWWVARHPGTPWVLRPVWSWSRFASWPHVVLRRGRYPAPVGRPPRGGAPMQGYPP